MAIGSTSVQAGAPFEPRCRRTVTRLYFATRIVAFPLTWLAYARSRAALPEALLRAQVPASVHAPLSLLHFALYGLMLNWGYKMVIRRS